MKVLVTGANGQLGSDAVERAISNGLEVIASDIHDKFSFSQDTAYKRLDITDEEAVIEAFQELRPDAVIHCAAWTAVDAADLPENEDKVRAINRNGTLNLAKACEAIGAKMLYISTDYVFNGKGEKPWDPDCEEFGPLNFYGQTKLEGELAVKETLKKFFIVRISWVFGQNGANFVKTMLRLAETHDSLSVVDDQIGRMTNTYDLSKLLCEMIVSDKYGIYHATNEGPNASWYEITETIFEIAGKKVKLTPVSTEQYMKGKVTAVRPFNSRMDTEKLEKSGFKRLPDWRETLGRFIKEL